MPDCSIAEAAPLDLSALLHFRTAEGDFLVPIAELLRCLQIAVEEFRVPPLDPGWTEQASQVLPCRR